MLRLQYCEDGSIRGYLQSPSLRIVEPVLTLGLCVWAAGVLAGGFLIYRVILTTAHLMMLRTYPARETFGKR